ncbi:hypothetical protein WJX74_000094 [Apatococcus lobatus]|uniref:MYB transcription factor n=1 Tax=Apatococcus lobatus TaxID=904363 RepID=A0AAW1SD90_9CHLO
MSRLKKAGPPKQKWTSEEETALREGVSKYGIGKWRLIQKDGAFAGVLQSRSNVDLKDKWRNLNMDSYTAAKEKARKRSKGVSKPVNKKLNKKVKGTAAARKAKRRDDDDDLEMDQEQHFDEDDDDDDDKEETDDAQDQENDGQNQQAIAHGHRVVDMIMAAIISLWQTSGSSLEDISDWIQDQYIDTAPSLDETEQALSEMVEASQLASIPGEAGPSYTLTQAMSEAVAKEESSALRVNVQNYGDLGCRRRDQRVWPLQGLLQAAEAAAAAVREAEEAAAYAAELCAAAEELEATG